VALAQADVLDRATDVLDSIEQPKRSFAARLREIRAIFFVGLGLLATLAWIAFLGWFLYRTVLMLGFV
jgi:hypothetical protein